MIQNIVMFTCAPIGLFCIGYTRVSFSRRMLQNPNMENTYTEKEKKIRLIGIIFVVIALAFAAIPAKYAF